MGIGICLFLQWEMAFRSLGLGLESQKKAKMGMGLVFCSHISGIGTLVSGIWKKWWLGNGIGNPPSGPSQIRVLIG